MKRAVFLDRDGVINEALVRDGLPYPPSSLEDFRINPEVASACRRLKAEGFLLIVATNQPDVGRGMQSREEVEAIHARMLEHLPMIDRVEVCYDPGGGTDLESRKPRPGMLLRAAAELGIDLGRSFMVGDRWRDIDCGHNAGCVTIFIDRGYAESLRKQPHYSVPDLMAAAEIILRHK